jgi:hypothetical protein
MGWVGLCGATATDECSGPLDVILIPSKCSEAVYIDWVQLISRDASFVFRPLPGVGSDRSLARTRKKLTLRTRSSLLLVGAHLFGELHTNFILDARVLQSSRDITGVVCMSKRARIPPATNLSNVKDWGVGNCIRLSLAN